MGTRTAVYENRTYGGVRGALHQRPLVEPSTRLAGVVCPEVPSGTKLIKRD